MLRAKPAQGAAWRLDYQADGEVFLDTGCRDTGRWRVERARLRAVGAPDEWLQRCVAAGRHRLYIRRTSNGEVVARLREPPAAAHCGHPCRYARPALNHVRFMVPD